MNYREKHEKFADYLKEIEKGDKGLYTNVDISNGGKCHVVAVPHMGIFADCGVYSKEHYTDILLLKATTECYKRDIEKLVEKIENTGLDLLQHKEVLCTARLSVSAEDRSIDNNYISNFLSIYTGSHHKRKGYGTIMMLLLRYHFIKYHNLVDNIYSMVKRSNVESYNFHKKIGAQEINIEDKNTQYPTLWHTGFSTIDKAHDFFVFSYK